MEINKNNLLLRVENLYLKHLLHNILYLHYVLLCLKIHGVRQLILLRDCATGFEVVGGAGYALGPLLLEASRIATGWVGSVRSGVGVSENVKVCSGENRRKPPRGGLQLCSSKCPR